MLTVMSTRTNTSPFQHKKSLGQNFLTSPVVPGWMCDAARITTGDRVIEIGPGTGALTTELLARGAEVTAFETDERAITVLQSTCIDAINTKKLLVHHTDVREQPLDSLFDTTKPYKVVANIPYYLSGFLLRTVLELPNPPSLVVFLMQKEVVHRITRDEKSSLLSLSVEVYGQPSYVRTVSRGHFHPAPAVDSAILLVDHISHTNFATIEEREAFFTHIHQGLGQKRKQLLGTLAKTYDREVLLPLFLELDLLPTVRGEDISLTTWLRLSKALRVIPQMST